MGDEQVGGAGAQAMGAEGSGAACGHRAWSLRRRETLCTVGRGSRKWAGLPLEPSGWGGGQLYVTVRVRAPPPGARQESLYLGLFNLLSVLASFCAVASYSVVTISESHCYL